MAPTPACAGYLAQSPADTGLRGLIDAAPQGQLRECECARTDDRPADVVLLNLLACLAADSLQVFAQLRLRLFPGKNASMSVSWTATPHSNSAVSSKLYNGCPRLPGRHCWSGSMRMIS